MASFGQIHGAEEACVCMICIVADIFHPSLLQKLPFCYAQQQQYKGRALIDFKLVTKMLAKILRSFIPGYSNEMLNHDMIFKVYETLSNR